MRTSALVLEDPVKKRRHWVYVENDQYRYSTAYSKIEEPVALFAFFCSGITIPASDDTISNFDVVAIVDPLSREAQRIGPLLTVSGKNRSGFYYFRGLFGFL